MGNKVKFEIGTVLAVSVAVQRMQGFVRSSDKVYDYAKSAYIYPNKDVVHDIIRDGMGLAPKVVDASYIKEIEVTEADHEQGVHIQDSFVSRIMSEKLSGNVSGFDEKILSMLTDMSGTVDTHGLSICASLPNSLEYQTRRDTIKTALSRIAILPEEERYLNAPNGQAVRLNVTILDAKPVGGNRHGSTVFAKTDDGKMIYWVNGGMVDHVIDALIGERVEINCVVRKTIKDKHPITCVNLASVNKIH